MADKVGRPGTVVRWKKSSRSNGNGGNNCVEVAFLDEAVAVRDSKDKSGPALVFTLDGWAAFLRWSGGVTDGDSDPPRG